MCNHPHASRLARALPVSLLGLIGLLSATPALALESIALISAWAQHDSLSTGQIYSDAADDSGYNNGPLARIRVMADSDGDSTLYHGLGISWAQVAAGGVQVYARAQSVSQFLDQEHTAGQGNATGIMTDVFGLNVPNFASGTVFTITAQVRIDGDAQAWTTPYWSAPNPNIQSESAAFSSWHSWIKLSVDAGGPVLAEMRASESCDYRTSGDLPPKGCVTTGLTGLQTLTFTMVNQGPQLQLYLNANAFAGTSAYHREEGSLQADSLSDMGHTLAWAGVTEIRDASGALVADYSLFSASSGFDYRNAYVSAVPDAPPAALLAAGLAMLGLTRRRWTRDA